MKGKTYYPPEINRLVTIQIPTTGNTFRVITVRVQDHLSIQFTYSQPDNDTIIGIALNTEDWKYDFEAEEFWDKKPEEQAWLKPGRRIQRAGRR